MNAFFGMENIEKHQELVFFDRIKQTSMTNNLQL